MLPQRRLTLQRATRFGPRCPSSSHPTRKVTLSETLAMGKPRQLSHCIAGAAENKRTWKAFRLGSQASPAQRLLVWI